MTEAARALVKEGTNDRSGLGPLVREARERQVRAPS